MAAFAGMCDGGSTEDALTAASMDETTIKALDEVRILSMLFVNENVQQAGTVVFQFNLYCVYHNLSISFNRV